MNKVIEKSDFEIAYNFFTLFVELLQIVENDKDNDHIEARKYLNKHFYGERYKFCEFLGFVNEEVKRHEIPQHHIVSLMCSMVLAGISIGHQDGYSFAKQIKGEV